MKKCKSNAARDAIHHVLELVNSRPINRDKGIKITDGDLMLALLYYEGFKVVQVRSKP